MDERQQINLYQPATDEGERPFSARAAGLTVAAVVASVLAIWAYGTWQVARVQASVAALEQQQKREDAAVAAAGTMHAARANPEQLQARIRELSAEVAIRRKALELLGGGAEGRPVGFSARLAGLARRHVDGLWIEHLMLSGSSGTMTLEGIASDPDLVPRYLHDLGSDPALAGARFDQLVIDRPRHNEDRRLARPAAPHDRMRFRAQSDALQPTQQLGQQSGQAS